jgi:hypothetical protein
MKLAQSDGMTAEELEDVIVKAGLKKAIEGDYKFYQDIMDRIHGKPTQKIQQTTTTLADVINDMEEED